RSGECAPPPVHVHRQALGRGGRAHVLWRRFFGDVATGSRVRRQDLQGREGGRAAGRAGHEIRAGRQPQDRQSDWDRAADSNPAACRRGDRVRRREFITLLGGAAAAWPLAARAQQKDRVRRIGVLMGFAADDPAAQRRILAFAQALAQLGWTDGRNPRIDIRWIAGDAERNRKYAPELLALTPDAIVATAVRK